ncbi:hypothetical protein ACFL3E_02445 [Patescibacteria group bacterium]
MGLFDFIKNKMVRNSVIVQTIDAIAKDYILLKENFPQLGNREIYKKIIEQRCKSQSSKDDEECQDLLKELQTGKINNLKELIFFILCEETKLLKTGQDHIQKVLNMIGENLDKKYHLE